MTVLAKNPSAPKAFEKPPRMPIGLCVIVIAGLSSLCWATLGLIALGLRALI